MRTPTSKESKRSTRSDEVLVEGAARVELYRPDGLVTYSNEHGLIGTAASGVLSLKSSRWAIHDFLGVESRRQGSHA